MTGEITKEITSPMIIGRRNEVVVSIVSVLAIRVQSFRTRDER